jgi:hypothetical protein
MKIFLACLAASVALSASSLAQTSTTGTTSRGTMTVYTEITVSPNYDPAKTTPTKTTSVSSEITVMAISTGQIQYGINPNAIQYGDPTVEPYVTTQAVYDAIAREAVEQGVARGYHPVTSTGAATTKVYDANSTVHEFSIQYDQSTYTPTVTETRESVSTVQNTVQ